MILSGAEISQAIQNGEIVLTPEPDGLQYSQSAVDLRLGDTFRRWNQSAIEGLIQGGLSDVVDPSAGNFSTLAGQFAEPVALEGDGCCLIRPQEFLLAVTQEFLELPLVSRIAARVEGRSSLARMGLMVHLTAPTIHAGFRGKIALEMVNLGPWTVKLRPQRLKVCQLILERVGEPGSEGRQSQFQDQTTPGGS